MSLDLAIVVPVGPDEQCWRLLIHQLTELDVQEIVIVFPTSLLAPPAKPLRFHPQVQVAFAQAGRARQLNAGADATRAKWIWFLHADSMLTDDVGSALGTHTRGDEDALGYFDLRFLRDGPPLMALNRLGAWMRSRWLGLPFGDQGFVVSRSLFERLQGFDAALPSGEDHDFIWRARAAGARLAPVGAPLYTSARKYAANGWWRTTAQHVRATWEQARAFSGRARA
ncbi:MAG: glycosyl transferase family 2 [Proteobacteria bacterium]|nr:glycosyl transferase family 2 [Pseudomonadota bacterium]